MQPRDLGLGVLLLEPTVFRDERGAFLESWHAERFARLGLDVRFVQDNVSSSRRHVLRGLHYQHPQAQGKLVMVTHGAAWDVAVDIRRDSPHFGRWIGCELDAERAHQLWIPPGFAHGFVALSERLVFQYKCTAPYDPAAEGVVAWNDPDLAIAWPVVAPVLSAKDATAPQLGQIDPQRLPLSTGVSLANGR